MGRVPESFKEVIKITKVEGYSGICVICFEPVRIGEEFRYLENGRTFHKNCIVFYPNSYYAKLERRRAARRRKEDKT